MAAAAPEAEALATRLPALRDMASRTMSQTLHQCSTDQFLENFTSMDAAQKTTVAHIYQQAMACLHENSMVRQRAIANSTSCSALTGAPRASCAGRV